MLGVYVRVCVALWACLFTCCVFKGVKACLYTRAVPGFRSNRLIDKERRSLQTKKNGSHSQWLKQYFSFYGSVCTFRCIHLLVIWSTKRVTASPGCFFFFPHCFYCAHMICVKVLRFSVAAARWYQWKEPLQPISYSVIREGCVGYRQLLHTTEYIIAEMAGKVELANV